MKVFNHENIVKFYDTYEDENYIYIVQEYCNGGCLEDFL